MRTRRSTSDYELSLAGEALSWRCRKKTVFAASFCEAEYIAIVKYAQEAILIR